jgi:hypothetical protein
MHWSPTYSRIQHSSELSRYHEILIQHGKFEETATVFQCNCGKKNWKTAVAVNPSTGLPSLAPHVRKLARLGAEVHPNHVASLTTTKVIASTPLPLTDQI